MDELKTDCRHFRSDRPCTPHKRHGVVCGTCVDDYDPIETRILIVKLAAIGDVLRTTSLLPAIHRRWPRAHITWVTSPSAAPMFAGNPLVDRVLAFDREVPIELVAERFDVVLNPDASAETGAVAHAARGVHRFGFGFDEKLGVAVPIGAGAEHWFQMGLRDDLKQANTRTYQDLIADVLGVDYRREPPIFEITDEQARKGRTLRQRHAPAGDGRVVGLNTGAGGRWRFKKWTEAGYTALTERLVAEGHHVWLLGGPEEVERNARLAASGGDAVLDTGCDNTLPEFAGVVGQCDAVVTGDTLAMHVAIARGVPTVVLFGPTSLHEIEVFDRGRRLSSDLPCLCCYLMDCDVRPHCMESLSVDKVHGAVHEVLALGTETPAT